MKNNVKTDFGWKPVIRIPENVPAASFIQGESASEFIDEFRSRTVKDYNDADALNVLSYNNKDKLITGSAPFAVVLVNQMVRNQGMRTATPADLEKVLATEALSLNGQYEDSGLVIRSKDGANDYIAKDIMTQVRARMYQVKFPIMIPLAFLDLAVDGNSPHGLGFKLREDSEIVYAPILNKEGNFDEVDARTGLPKKIGYGNRYNYTRKDGVSGLYLGGDLNLGSNNDDLANSSGDGRVVLVRGEASAQNLVSSYQQKLQTEMTSTKSELDAWYTEAMAKMPGRGK